MTSELLVRSISVSWKLIAFGVYALAITLLLGQGSYRVALGIILIGLLFQRIGARQRFYLTKPLKMFLMCSGLLFIQGVIAARGVEGTSPHAILWCMLATTGIMQFGGRHVKANGHYVAMRVILITFVVIHFIFDIFWTHWLHYGKSGMFSNPHYMAQYAVITLPIFFYFTVHSQGAVRLIIMLATMGDIWLLLESHSRPGYIAALVAAMVIIPFVASQLRWRIVAIMILSLGLIYYFNISNFSSRVNELAANYAQDERWDIWVKTINLQVQSSWLQWLFGHGLERYILDYKAAAITFNITPFYSPHNFIMEIIYSHGLFGMLVITVLYSMFLRLLVVTIQRHSTGADKQLGMVLLSMASAQLVHGFFTIPFFSRDYLLPLSFVLGGSFLYFNKGRQIVCIE